MKLTTNLKLKKPDLTDYVNVEDFNENADILDIEIKALQDGTNDIPTLETINKSIEGAINELKAKDDSFDTRITKNKDDIAGLNTQMAEKANETDETRNTTAKDVTGAINELKTEVDKKVAEVDGKGLSTNDYTTTEKDKFAGIEINSNNYVHPTSHLASMIVEQVNKRFLTDAERNKFTGIEINSNNYVHPTSHLASMIVEQVNKRFLTDAERNKIASTTVVTGSYTGSAVDGRLINVGGTPKFAIIEGYVGVSNVKTIWIVTPRGSLLLGETYTVQKSISKPYLSIGGMVLGNDPESANYFNSPNTGAYTYVAII